MSWTVRIIAVVIGLALAAGAIVALRPAPLDVETATVIRAPLAQKVVDDGKARIQEKYVVSAPVTGTLARIELHEGDVVEPGTVLARLLPLATPLLDPESRRTAEQRLGAAIDAAEQAKATMARARVVNEQAKTDLGRVEALAKQGAVSPTALDRATLDAHTTDSELASARFAARVADHQIAEARAALERFAPGATKSEQFLVTSPVQGQVLHVLRQSEGVVAAGTALLEVGDPTALELVADVLSQDAVLVHPGMPAEVVHWGGTAPLTAKVRRVEPAAFTKTSALGVDEQRVNVLLDLDDSPARWGPLGDGFAVEIEITIWSKLDAIQVPTSALFRRGDGWAVFAVKNGRAGTHAVEPGHRGPLQTEIVTGLSPGETVIVHPGVAVRDGVRVAFR